MRLEQTLTRDPVLLVAAHPDDETIGVGGLMPRLRLAAIVHITDGAPVNLADARATGYESRRDYARARRRELLQALELAGVREEQARTLGIPDQQASHNLACAARQIAETLRQVRPAIVLTHAYEGGHPDHDATAFAVRAACALSPSPPAICEFTSYHSSGGQMVTGRFLEGQEGGKSVPLTKEMQNRKQRMFQCFASQLHMLRNFSVEAERFRFAPCYDFKRAPHAGKLHYENFDWGVTADLWRRLAADAARVLGIQGAL